VKKILAALVVVFVLAACGGPNHGTVEAKSYHAPYTYTILTCYGYNSKGGCNVWVPVVHYEPAHWSFKLKTSQHQGWHEVAPSDYDKYGIGDQYP
jgi:hypothetical protein